MANCWIFPLSASEKLVQKISVYFDCGTLSRNFGYITLLTTIQTATLFVDSSKVTNPFFDPFPDPLHAASGNFEFLGGCGACGILSGNGVSKGFVITDVTDRLDSLDRSSGSGPPQGSHIDLCLPEFQEYVPGTTGNNGGIFTATWTR
jgi:hypothetical protein